MSIECTVCVSMPPGTRGTPPDGTGGGHTIHLKKAMAHFHWHADAYMLAIAASNILMYRHSYRFPQPGSVDTGVSHHPQVLQVPGRVRRGGRQEEQWGRGRLKQDTLRLVGEEVLISI